MALQFDSNYPSLTFEAEFPAPIGTVDITDYVISAGMFHGRSREVDRYDARGTFVLDNWDGRFTPGNSSSPYASGGANFVRPRVRINVRAVWAATTYYLHAGRATVWQDDWKAQGFDPTVTLSTTGLISDLARWIGQPLATPVGSEEFSGARVDRILTAASWAGGTSIGTGLVRLAETDLGGNGITLLEQVIDAEGGAFWIDPDGTAVFEDRAALVANSRSNSSQVTFSQASVFFRDARPSSGEDTLYNVITIGRAGGAEQTATDATSVAAYGALSYARTGLPALDDVDSMAVAEYNLARFKDPDARVAELTIDPASSPTLMWPHALGRRIRDRATVTAYVPRSATTESESVFIEGVGHQISQNSWTTSFTFSNAAPWNGFTTSVWDTGVWDTAKWYF